MSQASTSKDQCAAEFFDTRLLIFLGVDRVTALRVADASFGWWEVNIIWGLGVAMAIYLTAGTSGAYLSPAVTIALWLFACFDERKVIPFIISQVTGAFCAAALVYGLYCDLFFDFGQTRHIVRGSVESIDLAGTFSTYPSPHINFVQVFTVEMVITTILMGLILTLTDDGNGIPHDPLAPLLIGLLIAIIGTSMSPLMNFAINPACDFGPKVSAWLAGWGSVALTDGRDIPYFLIPFFGPIVDAIASTFAYRKLIGRHLPCDICVMEERETTTLSEQKTSL